MNYDVFVFAIYTLNIAGYDVTFNANGYDSAAICVQSYRTNCIWEFESIRELIEFAQAV